MYSYEDRIRAVKLYIKLGKHTGATIRQLGYPTKNSLKSWHEEYERCPDLSRGYVLSKPKYSLAQREKAVGYYLCCRRRIFHPHAGISLTQFRTPNSLLNFAFRLLGWIKIASAPGSKMHWR
jgi:hypothetical protein